MSSHYVNTYGICIYTNTFGCIRSVTFLACQLWDFHVIFVFGLSLQSNLESFAYYVKLFNMCSLFTCGGV